MALPSLEKNRKFRFLVDAVRSRLIAQGALELLWQTAYEAGNPVLGTRSDVERICGWSELVRLAPDSFRPGVLAAALVEAGGPGSAGFIEPVAVDCDPAAIETIWQVHDLEDHAPAYVLRRMQRARQRATEGRRRWERGQPCQTMSDNVSHCQTKSENVSTTIPVPIPLKTDDALVASDSAPSHPSEPQSDTRPEQKPFLRVVMVFPCAGGKAFALDELRLKKLEELYPQVDVRAVLAKLRARVEDPRFQYTEKGMWRAICNWLNNEIDWRAQRNGRPGAGPVPSPGASPDRVVQVATERASNEAQHYQRLARQAEDEGNHQAAERFRLLSRQAASAAGVKTEA